MLSKYATVALLVCSASATQQTIRELQELGEEMPIVLTRFQPVAQMEIGPAHGPLDENGNDLAEIGPSHGPLDENGNDLAEQHRELAQHQADMEEEERADEEKF